VTLSLKGDRLDRGLSLEAAAQEIDVPLNVLSRAESGEGMPHPANAKKIADFYGYKVTEIWPLDTKAVA
jgi:ribosome-binding protein aMBF1 (putative translation factor)